MATEIAHLIARQRQLEQQERLIKECLQLINTEKNKLQIEHLQLETMIADINENLFETSSSSKPPTVPIKDQMKPFELDANKVNKEDIDLNIMSSLDKMLEGRFFTENDIEEFEEEEEDISEEDDILMV